VHETKLALCHLVKQNSYTNWPEIEHGPPWSQAESISYRAVKLSVSVIKSCQAMLYTTEVAVVLRYIQNTETVQRVGST
jgi:hypothetical protein